MIKNFLLGVYLLEVFPLKTRSLQHFRPFTFLLPLNEFFAQD